MLKEKWTLTQVAAQVGQSHSWIKKIEEELAIPGWCSGRRGKGSGYEIEHRDFFKKVAVLRMIDISLPDIKKVYDAEKEINQFASKHFPIDDKTKKGEAGAISLYLIGDLYGSIDYDKGKYKSKKAEAAMLDKMVQEYTDFMVVVASRMDSSIEWIKNERENIREVTA